MTLKTIVKLIQTLSLDHKQIKSFLHNVELDEWLNDHKAKYGAAFLLDQPGTISVSGNATTMAFTMFFVDLVHVSEDTKLNELDVQSDMLSVARDIMAQLNFPINQFALSGDNQFSFLPILSTESDNDAFSGVRVDFSIRTIFPQNVCEIPSVFTDYGSLIDTPTNELFVDSKVYDLEYIATGAEGSSLTIADLSGKKIVFLSRESGVLYKVNSNPDSAEYTWDGTTIGLGAVTIPGARFLILYRNF